MIEKVNRKKTSGAQGGANVMSSLLMWWVWEVKNILRIFACDFEYLGRGVAGVRFWD
jgi:hypothetical protein